MKMREYLPIGSVVLLKNARKKLVIIGIKQIVQGEEEKKFDYMGLLYPEGYLTQELTYMFNHEDITDVIFRGYHNPEREQYLENVEKYLENQEEKKEIW